MIAADPRTLLDGDRCWTLIGDGTVRYYMKTQQDFALTEIRLLQTFGPVLENILNAPSSPIFERICDISQKTP